MQNLQQLQQKREEILSKIKEIEKDTKGIDTILDALKSQRWYFFKNKKTVLFDKDSGLLWANLNYFPYGIKQGDGSYKGYYWKAIKKEYKEKINEIIAKFDFEEATGFRIPDLYELWNAVSDKTIPFRKKIFNNYYQLFINNAEYWFVIYNNELRVKDLNSSNVDLDSSNVISYLDNELYCSDNELYCSDNEPYCSQYCSSYIFPCSSYLIDGLDYQNEVINKRNSIYTEKERLQHLLDIFVKHQLQPIFDDKKATQAYNKIYIEKANLKKELQALESEIQKLQEEQKRLEELAAKEKETLSSTFDYNFLLSKYNIEEIGSSMIQYYEAVQSWINELLQKINDYEKQKEKVILDFNTISLKLSKKYENNSNLTEQENDLLQQRQAFFKKNLSLGMHSVKSKLLAVKKQADDLEQRIDQIDEGQNSIKELALLEKEERINFSFLAENTAKIIKNALLKIEFFEQQHQFVLNAIKIWESWTENYKVFKTTYKEDLKNSCKEDDVEEEIWSKWYEDWRKLRFAIEEKIQPAIERGLKSEITVFSNQKENVAERLIAVLEDYKNNIDKFYLETRKGIYQKYVFQSGGELQEKFEAEGILYGFASTLQSELQNIIFDCKNAEDRIFILNWANSLLDISIDEILDFVANNDLQAISQEILTEFASLKQKNYDIYLADAKAYAEEKAKREKEYNSLVFKMRKDLMKQK